jgi:hypothetical protein
MEVQLMSDTTEQTNIALVFTDQDQNYYLIPAEIIERGRVPAERKAEVEQLMSEQEVEGYLLVHAAVGALVVTGAFATGVVWGAGAAAAGAAVGFAAGTAYNYATTR